MSDADNVSKGRLGFTVFHLTEMLEKLEERYRADFAGEQS